MASSGVATSQAALPGDDDFLPARQAFQYELRDNGDGTLTLAWDIAPGYYLYRKRMSIEAGDGELGGVQFPVGSVIHDEFFGESEVFYDDAAILIDSGTAGSLELAWQGCAAAGLCYPPDSATVELNTTPADSDSPDPFPAASQTKPATGSAADARLATDQSLTRQLDEGSLSWNLVVFFGLGLLLVFTPCVLPMIPILSTVIVGSEASPGRSFALSSVYVVSMAVTYALLGVAAAMAGSNLQAVLQAPIFIVAIGSVFVLLAMSMFGLYELQLPAFVRDRLSRVSQRQQGGSLASASAMGVVAALLASPCMTAPLAGALIYIADTGNTTLGGLALLALGLGMGTPLIALATFGAGFLPRPGVWMNGVKAVFGFILLGTTIYFLERILDDALVLALWGSLTVAAGLALWQVIGSISRTGALLTLTVSASAIITLWGGLMLIGAAAGGDRPLQPLKELSATARAGSTGEQPHVTFEGFKSVADLDRAIAEVGASGQWTLVEFYADWCVSCKVIEKEVFGDATVVSSLSDMQLLRADVTANDALDRELMRELSVVGPPTILIVGPDGQERRPQRTTGEVSAQKFLDRLARARES
ncbi:protein-disulfide reductase DsbD [Kineobactrum salinum]|nr:protein-disulfide reductase DsbD [Kineobactrum salinum]